MDNNSYKIPSRKKRFSPLMKKITFLIVLLITLLIPLIFVGELVERREKLFKETVKEIGNEWGKSQKIIAPVISLSYKDSSLSKDDRIKNEKNVVVQPVERRIAILPEELNVTVELKDELKHRGIYNATVYTANMKLTGYFSTKDFPDKNDMIGYLSIGLSDTKALVKVNKFKLGNVEKDLEVISGTMANPLFTNGISGNIGPEYDGMMKEDKIPFEIDIDFRGSRKIYILPLGKKNHFDMKSNWKSPSFSGVLPVERNIDGNGFTAKWEVSNLIRNYPQVLDIDKDIYYDFKDSYSDVDYDGEESTIVKVLLYNSVTDYTQIYRACRYGILFISMSLVIVYIFEIVSKKVAHYVQYIVVGFSLVMFYLLLLSLSEHLGFEMAYLLASLAIVIPNSLYVASMTDNKKFGIGMFIFLSGIYAILFSILRMEQYALLAGTLLILAMLYVVMYLTKKADIFFKLEEENN
ncbi:cell envelope integrity protein CreD [Fusobacterium sp. 27098_8_59]|uniref:cell envelope integrity protein CreD n=1 Tax=Fusobacterium sp. 27098_8_59 TaxID=3003691 RepID=UPI00352E383A